MTSSVSPLRWGIIGPGAIARDFRRGVADSRLGKLEAIATRNPDKPGLAEDFAGARILEGYDTILRDPDVDAIYIATPHTGHAEWAIKAAEAGKHALIEKPMALSAHEVDAVIHAHRKAGTFVGEAFMYRLHPQTRKLWELVASGAIGEVRAIKSSFGFQMGKFIAEHRLFASELGRRRHPRCRRLPGLDVALHRRRRVEQAVPRSGQGLRHGDAQPGGHRQLGRGAAAVRQRHHRRGQLLGLRQPGQRAAHPRLDRPHRGAELLVRRRRSRRRRGPDRHHPQRRHARDHQRRQAAAPLSPSRRTPSPKRSAPAGRSSPRPA